MVVLTQLANLEVASAIQTFAIVSVHCTFQLATSPLKTGGAHGIMPKTGKKLN